MKRRPRVPGTTTKRTLFVLPEIADDLPVAVKSALGIRNAASTSGVCPDCGARGRVTGPDKHGILHLVFEHAHGCGVFSDGEAA